MFCPSEIWAIEKRDIARVLRSSLVPFQVKCQMVWASECPLAVWTLKRFDSSVLPHVPSQLVWSSKLPAATFPGTLVGFFPGVRSLVSLEVRALGVDLVAAWVGAAMHSLVSLWLGGVVVDGVHQLVWIVGGQSWRHDVMRKGRVLLYRRGGIGAGWRYGVVVEWRGSRVASSRCCSGSSRVVVGSVRHVGIQVDGDRCGLSSRVRGRRQSGKVGQLCLRRDRCSGD